VIVEKDLHSRKDQFPSSLTEEGMQIDESDEQESNANAPIDESLESDSNVNVERDSHSQKHCLPIVSTDEGMQIDESDEQEENTDSPIDETFEPLSKTTSEMLSLPKKHPRSSRSMVFGIVTSRPLPKYIRIEIPSKSKRKSPMTLKCRFPSETEISRRFPP
jgi:hypothetical protein